jgi:DUF4097 and DUF4098 domain-containing protein YvlB
MESLKEEKLQILKMVEEGKVTSEEGISLLEALGDSEKSYIENGNAKWIKIRVFDPDDNTKVNVTIPISLVNVGLKMANKFSPELKNAGFDEKDLKEIFEAIKDGASGKIVDVESDNGEKVEIIVE